MGRIARTDQKEIEAALRTVVAAQTVGELRQSLAFLIPALTGASLEVTATILGVSRSRVCLLRRQLRTGRDIAGGTGKRGGRRRALMSIEDEARFLQTWLEGASRGGTSKVAAIHSMFEELVGRRVPKSTIYRLLARHGWHPGAAGHTASL